MQWAYSIDKYPVTVTCLLEDDCQYSLPTENANAMDLQYWQISNDNDCLFN